MHFIVKTGYSPNDFIRINSLEDLERAQFAFMTNAKVVFSNGQMCRGQDIISIREDWHAEMGWNKNYRRDDGSVASYELGNDDWNEIRKKGVDKKYLGILAEVKERVEYLRESGNEKLIGKGIEIKFPEKPKEIATGMSALAAKFNV